MKNISLIISGMVGAILLMLIVLGLQVFFYGLVTNQMLNFATYEPVAWIAQIVTWIFCTLLGGLIGYNIGNSFVNPV